MNEQIEYFKRFSKAHLHYVDANFDRIVQDVYKQALEEHFATYVPSITLKDFNGAKIGNKLRILPRDYSHTADAFYYALMSPKIKKSFFQKIMELFKFS